MLKTVTRKCQETSKCQKRIIKVPKTKPSNIFQEMSKGCQKLIQTVRKKSNVKEESKEKCQKINKRYQKMSDILGKKSEIVKIFRKYFKKMLRYQEITAQRNSQRLRGRRSLIFILFLFLSFISSPVNALNVFSVLISIVFVWLFLPATNKKSSGNYVVQTAIDTAL